MADGGATASARDDGEKGFTVSGQKNKEFDDLPKYLPWMIECARRLVPAAEATDLANRALLAAHKPTKSRAPADDEKRVKAWLSALLKFEAMAFWKKALKQGVETPLDDGSIALASAEPTHWETTIENRQWLQLGLSELSAEQRNLVIECDIEETSLAQLSRMSGINENTLNTRLRRAHNQLRTILIALAGGRLGAFVPFWLLRWLIPRDAEKREPWALRIRRVLRQMFRQRVQLGGNVVAVACVLGLAPGGPCAKDAPLDVVIAPEPIATVPAESAQTTEVFPGTNAREQAEPTSTRMPSMSHISPKKSAAAPQEEFTGDEDDRLLMRAKAALNRRDAKSALEFLAEHERRFPNSKNAGRRQALRAKATKSSAGKP